MSTALDLDISELVGEMPAEPCESTSHDPLDSAHDDGPATHYARLWCNKCGDSGVKAYCLGFTLYIQRNEKLRCPCGHVAPAEEMAVILGPVGGAAT